MRTDFMIFILLLSVASVSMTYYGSFEGSTKIIYGTASELRERVEKKLRENLPECCPELTKECLSCATGLLVKDFCSRHAGEYGCPNKTSSVCIVTAYKKPNMKELFKYSDYEKIIPHTLSNMWDYARRHNYKIYLFNEDSFDTSRKSSWVKIPLIKKYFNTCDWVMYTDVDWLFVADKPLPLDDNYDIIVSNECIRGNEWKKMSGTMILKNSDWSKKFLDTWDSMYQRYKNVMNHDQIAFEKYFRQTPKEMKVIPPEDFMTYDTHHCVKPKFGIHFPAGNKYKRLINVMNKYNIPKLQYSSARIAKQWVMYQVPFAMHGLRTDIVVGVLSHSKEKRMAMRQKYPNIKMFFLVGKGFDYHEFDKYHDMIFINRKEEYMGEKSILPYKTQIFFHAVKHHVAKYKYLLKIDDDTMVRFDQLREELGRTKPDYWGRVWYKNIIDRNPKSKWYVSKKTFPAKRYPDYCSGAGYVLSKKANDCIVNKLPKFRFMPREDVATGILAGKCGIRPVNSQRVQHMKPYSGDDFIIRHYVKHEWCDTHEVLPNGAFCNKKYAGMDKGLARSIASIIPKGSSISDLGAGGGWYTDYFNKNGFKSYAYDASPVRPAHVKYIDLTKDIHIDQRDWTVSLEVGEHLPKQFESTYLNNVARSNNVILSWAIPGQGGNNHVNLQPNNYIISQMEQKGYQYDRESSNKLRKDSTFSWFKKTLMVFKKKNFLKHSFEGGQGNQIWQYLALKGIEEKHGSTLCGNAPKITLMNVHIHPCPDIPYKVVKEKNRKFLNIPHGNIEIKGYLQYEKYFGKRTIKNFHIKREHIENAKRILSVCSEWIGLHIRIFPRGHPDISLPLHAYDDILYELKAKYPEACLYVASNEKIEKKYEFKKVVYSKNSGDIDLTVLTQVNHLIITTGSFAYISAVKNIHQDVYYHKDQKYLMGYDNIEPPKHWNKWGFKTYSQARQDLLALALSNTRNNGYFVEIGANDGKTFSNTLMLEDMGWRGLLIEASPSLCKKNPRKAKWYCGCLSDKKSVTFKTEGTLGRISTTGTTVPCTNPSIFKEEIDFFSLDVEGAEMDILNLMKPYLMNSTVKVNMWSIEYRIWDEKIFYKETLEKLKQIRDFFKGIGGYTEYGALSNKPMNGVKDGLDIVFVKTILLPKNTERVQINIGSNVDPIHGKRGIHTLIFEPIVPDKATEFARKSDIQYGGTSKVYPYAVSNYTGVGVMFKYNNKGMSSSFSKPKTDNYWNTDTSRGDGKEIKVKIISFVEILQGIDKPITFVKTDMQGYDFTAVSSAGSLLYKINKIQTEVYTGPSTYKHVQNDMCKDWLPFMKKWGWHATNFDGKCNVKRELDIIWVKN